MNSQYFDDYRTIEVQAHEVPSAEQIRPEVPQMLDSQVRNCLAPLSGVEPRSALKDTQRIALALATTKLQVLEGKLGQYPAKVRPPHRCLGSQEREEARGRALPRHAAQGHTTPAAAARWASRARKSTSSRSLEPDSGQRFESFSVRS